MASDSTPGIRPSLNASAREFTDPATFQEPIRSRVQMLFDNAKAALAEDFQGISEGERPEGLFPVFMTGVSTKPVIEAANAFRAVLSEVQLAEATFPVDDDATWRSWSNLHLFLFRHGVSLNDLAPAQRAAALKLVEASSSAAGYASARGVMKLNHHAGELTDNFEEYGEWYYWMSFFGEPSATEPWGWQIDGHHLIVNCFVLGDQMVMTPDFRGSEPVLATSGDYQGTEVFREEQDRGFAFMQALTPDQQARAIVGADLPRDVITSAQEDNRRMDFEGLRADALTTDQRALLVDLIETYVGRIRPGHDRVRMDEVQQHLDETWFA